MAVKAKIRFKQHNRMRGYVAYFFALLCDGLDNDRTA